MRQYNIAYKITLKNGTIKVVLPHTVKQISNDIVWPIEPLALTDDDLNELIEREVKNEQK